MKHEAFNDLVDRMIGQIDIDVVFAVYVITAAIKATLNIWSKTRNIYTDWLTPYVAITLGIAFGVTRRGLSLETVLYGIALGGSTIFFQQLYDKSTIALKFLRGKTKDDPVIQAKHQQVLAETDERVAKVKAMLNLNKTE